MIVGIDPGVTGGIAILYAPGEVILSTNSESTELFDPPELPGYVFDMPALPKPSGKGNQVDPYQLHRLLSGYPITRVYLEAVSAMPSIPGKDNKRRTMGATSAFTFGKSVGMIEGVIATLNVPIINVSPATWKRRAGLNGKQKDCGRTLAIQLHPSLAQHLQRKRDIGRADALLIAHFGSERDGHGIEHGIAQSRADKAPAG